MTASDPKAYDAALRELIQVKVDKRVGSDTSALPVAEKFAFARAELRRQSQDGRSESFNSIYGLSRGLVSAGALVLVVALVCVIVGHAAHRNWIMAAVVGGCVVPVFVRFKRFGFYFADQVWRDFAALS
jgi:Flp pilus assembly protein TadB